MGKGHIEEIRTNLSPSQNIWRKKSCLKIWFVFHQAKAACSIPGLFSHMRVWSLVPAILAHFFFLGNVLEKIRTNLTKSGWSCLEKSELSSFFSGKTHSWRERRREKGKEPFSNPATSSSWQRQSMIDKKRSRADFKTSGNGELPQLLIRLYSAPHLIRVYLFFFFLQMGTITAPISCWDVASPQLLRSVKHLQAIRGFCFSTTLLLQ